MHREREPIGAARAACFEEVAGVSASSSALHYAKDLFKPEEMVLRSKYPPFFDPDSVNQAELHIFDNFREFQSKNRRVF